MSCKSSCCGKHGLCQRACPAEVLSIGLSVFIPCFPSVGMVRCGHTHIREGGDVGPDYSMYIVGTLLFV